MTTRVVRAWFFGVFASAALGAAACHTRDRDAPPLKWSDIEALPQPPADATLPYGPGPSQRGELRIPPGAGPFPVVVLLHGGCWQSEYALDYIRNLAGALTRMGLATWTPEYRRIGEAGGGFPGTFLDVAAATDHLRVLATSYPLDLAHVVTAGHSAGGHLALWLAARPKLPAASPLAASDPLPIRAVVTLAGIVDLGAYASREGSCNRSTPALMGGAPSDVPARYHDGSPAALLPIGVAQYVIQGEKDPIVPPDLARSYVDAASKAGDPVELVVLAKAGHFDLVSAGAPAWPRIADAFMRAARR